MSARPVRAAVPLLVLALALPSAAGATSPGANGLIAFTGCPQTSPSQLDCGGEIWTVAPDGSGARQVTSMHDGTTDARWRPDGRELALTPFKVAVISAPADVLATRVFGTGPLAETTEGQRTMRPSNMFDVWGLPSWAPDGSAFVIAHGGGLGASEPIGLHVITAHGFTRVLLESGSSGYDRAPVWSPDGTQIAFLHSQGGGPTEIHVIDPQEPAAMSRLVIASAAREITDVDWAPDGRRLIFGTGSDIGRPWEVPGDGIWSVKPDGSDLQHLRGDGTDPAYSPDGTKVVFSRPDGLYVMPAAGGAATLLRAGFNARADWQAVEPPPAPGPQGPAGPGGPAGPAGAAGPQGPAGAPAPVTTSVRSSDAPTPLLALRSTALRVDGKGDVRVGLVCRPGPCAGAIELTTRGRKPRTLATKTLTAQAGITSVTLRLARGDARRVRAKALDVYVRSALASPAGKTVSQRLAARLGGPPARRR